MVCPETICVGIQFYSNFSRNSVLLCNAVGSGQTTLILVKKHAQVLLCFMIQKILPRIISLNFNAMQ